MTPPIPDRERVCYCGQVESAHVIGGGAEHDFLENKLQVEPSIWKWPPAEPVALGMDLEENRTGRKPMTPDREAVAKERKPRSDKGIPRKRLRDAMLRAMRQRDTALAELADWKVNFAACDKQRLDFLAERDELRKALQVEIEKVDSCGVDFPERGKVLGDFFCTVARLALHDKEQG